MEDIISTHPLWLMSDWLDHPSSITVIAACPLAISFVEPESPKGLSGLLLVVCEVHKHIPPPHPGYLMYSH